MQPRCVDGEHGADVMAVFAHACCCLALRDQKLL